MNPLREKFEYWLSRGFFTILRYCPRPIMYGWGRFLADLFYLIDAKRRRITHHNLSLAFPEMTKKQRVKRARAVYRHFGRFIAESSMILCGKIGPSDLEELVDGREIEKFKELEKSSSKGILVITGHLGNFELLAHYTGYHSSKPGHVVARKGSNRLIDDRIVTPMRKSFGNNVIYKHRALPQIVKALKKGENIGLLIDIKSNSKQGVPVQFFGQDTLGLKSSAYLQIKFNPLVVPITMARIAPEKYKLIIGDPIEWEDNGQPLEDQIQELTQIHQNVLEEMIRQYPEQWLWLHNRWKRK